MTILSPVRVAAAIVIVAAVLTGQSQPPVKPVRISGRVLDISNAVIPNSNVRLVMAGTGEIVGETKTDERGIYIITVTDRAPRQYELRLEARGFRPIVIPVMVMGKDMQLPEFFLQMIPEPYGVVVWPVSQVLKVSGRVTDPNGHSIEEAKVTVHSVTYYYPEPLSTVRTDHDGQFELATVLRPGKYELHFESPGFIQRTLKFDMPQSVNPFDVGMVVLEIPRKTPLIVYQGVFRGIYRNGDYGFSLEIPAGLVGAYDAAPAPSHGFAIYLGEKSVVWVGASYENMPDSPHVFGTFNARLGKLKAERKSWSDTEHGIELFHESIAARGLDRHTPIIYTIQLDTTAEHRIEGLRAFEAIINSFRTIPVRP